MYSFGNMTIFLSLAQKAFNFTMSFTKKCTYVFWKWPLPQKLLKQYFFKEKNIYFAWFDSIFSCLISNLFCNHIDVNLNLLIYFSSSHSFLPSIFFSKFFYRIIVIPNPTINYPLNYYTYTKFLYVIFSLSTNFQI